jgi:hypothetical protein
MKNFILVITYKDGTVRRQQLFGTIEQASAAIQGYALVSTIKSVILQYK